MNSYDDIKKDWHKRPVPTPPQEGEMKIISKAKYLHQKQTISQIVLGITVVILVIFFLYVSAYKSTEASLGLGLMIGSLVIRIVTEYFFKIKKRNFPLNGSMMEYKAKLVKYYNSRKYIHFIMTPVLYLVYIFGFVMLLPSFKQTLSEGFYLYIICSSVVVFLVLGWFIAFQVRKELFILKELFED